MLARKLILNKFNYRCFFRKGLKINIKLFKTTDRIKATSLGLDVSYYQNRILSITRKYFVNFELRKQLELHP